MPALADFLGQLAVAWAVVANTWWIFVPPLLAIAGWQHWLYYLKVRYFSLLSWVLLEVRIPRDIAKTPEAMEQVFAGLQALYWDFDPDEVYWLGLQHDYVVFEMVSLGGETRFYVRVPVHFRNLVEAQIYAQYPEAEIAEAEDYMALLPDRAPSDEWDLFGLEFNLEKDDAYPIRTFQDFRSLTARAEEFEKVDPFASLAECLGKCGAGEHIGYHLLLRPAQTPTPNAWRERGQALVDKLIGRKAIQKKGKIAQALEPLEPLTTGWGEPLRPLFGLGPATPEAAAKKEEAPRISFLPPDIDEQVKAIRRNVMKPGFETVIRFIYLARRDRFSHVHVAAFIGGLKTYNSPTLNSFKFNGASVATSTPWWWPKFMRRRRKAYQQRLFYRYYRARKPFTDIVTLRSKPVVLTREELATIYPSPGRTAKAPMLPRIEARRSEPPAP